MNLFIIGNGFDKAHNIKSDYSYFIEFIKKKYRSIYGTDIEPVYNPPFPDVMHHGELSYDKQDTMEFLYALLCDTDCGHNWSDLENALGRLNYNDFLETEVEGFRDVYRNEDTTSAMSDVVGELLAYMQEWAEQIDIGKPAVRKRFAKLIEPDDVFLTFNYTRTLEIVYGIGNKSICHIHGVQGDDKLIFGHGDDIDENRLPFGAEAIVSLHECLRKNVISAYNKNINFFNRLNEGNVEKIYSYGFSFGNADLYYIRQIMSQLNGAASCCLRQNGFPLKYDKDAFLKQQDIVRSCGFKGRFGKPFY